MALATQQQARTTTTTTNQVGFVSYALQDPLHSRRVEKHVVTEVQTVVIQHLRKSWAFRYDLVSVQIIVEACHKVFSVLRCDFFRFSVVYLQEKRRGEGSSVKQQVECQILKKTIFLTLLCRHGYK